MREERKEESEGLKKENKKQRQRPGNHFILILWFRCKGVKENHSLVS